MLESVGGESILTQRLLLPLLESSNKVGEHEANEGEVVQFGQSCNQPLVVASRSSKACYPGKVPFGHPAARQQDEAVFGAPQHISATNHIYAIMTRGRLTAEACKYLYNIITGSPERRNTDLYDRYIAMTRT